MADKNLRNFEKRCPQCDGKIDYFGSCRKCGREWSEGLEVGEKAAGLPEGEQHKSEVRKVGPRKTRKSRFTKSKEQLAGLEAMLARDAGVAAKYAAWQIDAMFDDDTEIIRKRSLMRLDSRKVYSALGLSMRAHDQQKSAILSLSHLGEFLEEDERKALIPTLEHLKQSFVEVSEMFQAKVAEATEMEKALEKAHKSARRARLRIATEDWKRQAARKAIIPGEDTEGYSVPEPVDISSADLLAQAKEKLLSLDADKALRKKVRPEDLESE
jgi:predicted O-linked N-acetylglucosamine transferase (SPINDLY family)